jgi:hypothetical protein
MSIINNISNNVVLVNNGEKAFFGNAEKAIKNFISYTEEDKTNLSLLNISRIETEEFKLNDILVCQNNSIGNNFINTFPIIIDLKYEIKKRMLGFRIGFDLYDQQTSSILFRSYQDDLMEDTKYLEPGQYSSCVKLPVDYFKEGGYVLNIIIGIHNQKWISKDDLRFKFNIINIGGVNKAYNDSRPGIISPVLQWVNS